MKNGCSGSLLQKLSHWRWPHDSFVHYSAVGAAGRFLGAERTEIANKASAAHYYAGGDGRANLSMQISGGRNRDMVILRKNLGGENGRQNTYVHFSRPADVNNTAFLVWKNPQGHDDRWLYLPALDAVRRIAASDGRTSFVGSHFYYEDMSGRSPSADNHTLVETTDNYYVLDSTPKSSQGVEFVRYRSYIHKTTFLPTKVEYFNSRNQNYRTYEALTVQTVQGIPTVVQAKMTDSTLGGYTVIRLARVRYGLDLANDVFTERSCARHPLTICGDAMNLHRSSVWLTIIGVGCLNGASVQAGEPPLPVGLESASTTPPPLPAGLESAASVTPPPLPQGLDAPVAARLLSTTPPLRRRPPLT
ncbi:MAG: outer membrane lipoprotein-sorting protein [Thiolinea sp.]